MFGPSYDPIFEDKLETDGLGRGHCYNSGAHEVGALLLVLFFLFSLLLNSVQLTGLPRSN